MERYIPVVFRKNMCNEYLITVMEIYEIREIYMAPLNRVGRPFHLSFSKTAQIILVHTYSSLSSIHLHFFQ